jgi:hypothetical protein
MESFRVCVRTQTKSQPFNQTALYQGTTSVGPQRSRSEGFSP